MNLVSFGSAAGDWAAPLLAQADVGRDALGDGLAIAAAGLVIVFFALILISLFIAALPRVLGMVNRVWPEVIEGHHEVAHPESQIADDVDVLAAIGFVLHTEFQRQLSAEPSTVSKN